MIVKERIKYLRRRIYYSISPSYRKSIKLEKKFSDLTSDCKNLKTELKNLKLKSVNKNPRQKIAKKFTIKNTILKHSGGICYRDKNNNDVNAYEALKKFIESCKNTDRILDIGCGINQTHSNIMRDCDLSPITCDKTGNADYKDYYENINFDSKFDSIWCSHVLEHTLNPDLFLRKICEDIKEGGLLCITVPPLKHKIVGGHVNLFNPGLLAYRLIIAGFDCSNAMIKSYGYNISIIMKVKKITNNFKEELNFDKGDIEILNPYFPFDAKQGFDGNFSNVNWI